MSQVSVKNNTGRSIAIPFAVDAKGNLTENVVFTPGINLVNADAWDQVKKHPAIASLTQVIQGKSSVREESIEGSKKFNVVHNRMAGKPKFEVLDARVKTSSAKDQEKAKENK